MDFLIDFIYNLRTLSVMCLKIDKTHPIPDESQPVYRWKILTRRYNGEIVSPYYVYFKWTQGEWRKADIRFECDQEYRSFGIHVYTSEVAAKNILLWYDSPSILAKFQVKDFIAGDGHDTEVWKSAKLIEII